MGAILSVVASVLLVVVVVIYMVNAVRGDATPNPVFFGVRSVLATINTITFFGVVHHDAFKWLVTVISTAGLFLVFAYSVASRKTPKVGWVDMTCLAGAAVIFAIWKLTDGITANLLLQAVMVFAFSPQVINIAKGRTERPLPWTLATLAYVLMTAVVCLNWKGWEGLVHPVVSGICGNGTLMILAIRQHGWRWRMAWR